MGIENPEIYRRNYGFRLLQAGYDGAMPYAYQHTFGNSIWRDDDSANTAYKYRDHCFAYPTANGIIRTLQFDGYREAIDDVRYLATLQNIISESSAPPKVLRSGQNLVSFLETRANYDVDDLDKYLNDIKDHILYLTGHGPKPDHFSLCGNGIRENGEVCENNDFNSASCSDFNYAGGNLTCTQDCTIDISSCTPPRILLSFSSSTPENNSTVNGSSPIVSVKLESTLPASVSIIVDNDGPVAHWNFNGNNIGAGGISLDSSGNGYNASPFGGVEQLEGAVNLDGVADYLSAGAGPNWWGPTNADPSDNDKLTVFARIRI